MSVPIGVLPTKSLCRSCKRMKPKKDFVWEHANKLYCSHGCAVKAAWLFAPIPEQRRGA